MRNLISVGAIMCLAACATVTVKPASMTTSLVTEESQLTKTARAYQTQIEQAGWVEKTSAFAFLQSRLFETEDSQASQPKGYLETISASTLTPDRLAARIIRDTRSARIGLLNLNTNARDFLSADDPTVTRKDVVAFEDALVMARKASKSFSDACNLVMETSPLIAADVTNALKAFEAEIDVSRQLADEITSIWQGSNSDIS